MIITSLIGYDQSECARSMPVILSHQQYPTVVIN